MDIEAVTKTLGASALLVGLLAYLGRLLLDHLLEKTRKEFESKLTADAHSQLESLRHELQTKAFEHQVRFQRLHETISLVIAELYRKLDCALFSTQEYISPFVAAGAPSEEERGNAAKKATNGFIQYYYENKLFFPEDTCAVVETLITEHKTILVDFELRDLEPKERVREWRRVNVKFKDDVANLKRQLEARFREQLGVNQPKPRKSPENET